MASGDQNEVAQPPQEERIGNIWEGKSENDIAIAYLNSALSATNPTSENTLDSIEEHLESKNEIKYLVAEQMLSNDMYTQMGSPENVPERLRRLLVDGLTAGFETDNADTKRERLAKIANDFSGAAATSFEGSFITGADLQTVADNIINKVDINDAEIKTFWDKLLHDIEVSKEEGMYGESLN